MEKDVFKFEDFLGNGTSLESMKMRLIREGILTNEEIQEIEKAAEEAKSETNEEEAEKEEEKAPEQDAKPEDDDRRYKLYRDKSEDFVCDISIEGANSSDTEARLIIESDEWNLMFRGEIANGKCVIPIKKLSILGEGQTGKIRLEVNVDGNLFTPWEDKFVVKASKKVTVKVSENSNYRPSRPAPKNPGIRVNVNR